MDLFHKHLMVLPGFPKKTPNEHFYERHGDALWATWGHRLGAPLGATGELWGQKPPQGAIWKLENFRHFLHFRFFGLLTTTYRQEVIRLCRQGAPYQKCPPAQPSGVTVWELEPPPPPRKCHFCRLGLQLADSPKRLVLFLSYLACEFRYDNEISKTSQWARYYC